jgi:hypothetical protein
MPTLINCSTPTLELAAWLVVAAGTAVVLGHWPIKRLHSHIEAKAEITREAVFGEKAPAGVPSEITGAIERAVFAPAFVLAPDDAAVGIFAWLALKMAANWQRDLPDSLIGIDWLKLRSRAFLALLSGFASLALAAVIGLAVRGYLGCPLAVAD